jgi:TPR repeat protein
MAIENSNTKELTQKQEIKKNSTKVEVKKKLANEETFSYLKLENECNSKNHEACVSLAFKFEKELKFKKAYLYLTAACNQGLIKGCFHAGRLSFKIKKFKSGDQWMQKACYGEDAEACYQSGKNNAKNKVLSTLFYKKSCELGHQIGCQKLKGNNKQ